MAIKCPNCGYSNDNKMSFCSDCGEPLDSKVRLVMELEGKVKPIHYAGIRMSDEDPEKKSAPKPQNQPKRRSRYDDDDFEYIPLTPRQKERNKTLYKLLFWAIAAAAALSYYIFFLR